MSKNESNGSLLISISQVILNLFTDCTLLSSGLSESGFGTFPPFLKYTWLLAETLKQNEDVIRSVSLQGFVAMMGLTSLLLFIDAVRFYF